MTSVDLSRAASQSPSLRARHRPRMYCQTGETATPQSHLTTLKMIFGDGYAKVLSRNAKEPEKRWPDNSCYATVNQAPPPATVALRTGNPAPFRLPVRPF